MIDPVNESTHPGHETGCSCCNGNHDQLSNEISRRKFVQVTGTSALGAVAMSGLSWSAPDLFANNEIEDWDPNKPFIVSGKELKVQPILMYSIQERKEQTSWKSWGSIRSEQSAAEEAKRITRELSDLSTRSGFPLQILPLNKVRTVEEAAKIHSNDYDVIVLYPATGGGQVLQACFADKKDTIIFVRHQSGPIYYWYEALSTAYLKTDKPGPVAGYSTITSKSLL